MKIAVISNINTDSVVRLLKKKSDADIFDGIGYGNELGAMTNPDSALLQFAPELLFVIIDTAELIAHQLNTDAAAAAIRDWFAVFESALQPRITYCIADAHLRGGETQVQPDCFLKQKIENIWNENLFELAKKYANVQVFSLSALVQQCGQDGAFSAKMWYMGKIPYSFSFQNLLADALQHRILLESRTPKKVLLLDLDNTLWKGLAGEDNHSKIGLSDDGVECAYKDFQRVLRAMKDSGVILGIVSKNNFDDAMQIIRLHPHMVLREEDFAAIRINWKNKAHNILSICKELNVGEDSVVFLDDSPAERQLIRETLPAVAVPDFPAQADALPEFAVAVYRQYFEKSAVTQEDKQKTAQYKANQKRDALLQESVSFDAFLQGLDMKMIRVKAQTHFERILQLVNKTNQFNLTTKRYTAQELQEAMDDKNRDFFVYRVTDRFGDNGVVIVAVLQYAESAVIEEFTMSCRVMGRNIEQAVLEDMELAAEQRGYTQIKGICIPTPKNKPVQSLYPALGYEPEDNTAYVLQLSSKPQRNYKLQRQQGE